MSAPSRSKRGATRGRDHDASVVEGDFPAPPGPPHTVAMSSGRWAYATTKADGYERGVYREANGAWLPVAPLPHVLERLVRRDGAGRPSGIYYRLSMTRDADDVVIVDDDAIKDGTWADRLDVSLSADPKIVQAVATALRDTARRHGKSRATELVPRWHNKTLELPPTDVGPPGYGDCAEDEHSAREAWKEIADVASRTPKLAVLLGSALGSLYVDPLERQAHVMYLTGDGGKGKTTGLRAAAAVVGNPQHVVKLWNTTVNGMGSLAVDRGCLPICLDELGASGFRPDQIETALLRLANGGNDRTTSQKTGDARYAGKWHSVLICNGNDSIMGQVTNEGVARRLIEIAAPITNNAADSELLCGDGKGWPGWLHFGYGWPLHWLRSAGMDLEGMAALIERAEQDLPLPTDSVPRSLSKHLALAIAGAERLETITHTSGIREAAVTVAGELLDTLIQEISERGTTADQRVLAMLSDAIASRPQAFVPRSRYRDAITNTGVLVTREVEGWLLDDDPDYDADVAIRTQALTEMCRDAGLPNPRTALRELAKQKVLLRGQEADGRLRQKLRVGTANPVDVYIFKFPADDGNDPSDTGNTPDNGLTSTNAEDDAAFPFPDTSDATGNGNTTGNGTTSALTSENSDTVPGVPGVPGADEQCHVREPIVTGIEGPVWLDNHTEGQPCRLCGQGSTPCIDRLGPVHPVCATASAETPVEHPATPAPAKDPQSSSSRRQRAAQPQRERLELCGVLDLDGLWRPGRDEPDAVELPANVGAAYRLAAEHRLRQLWVHPSVHSALNIPETRAMSAEVTPATAIEHPWTSVDDYRVDTGHGSGLAAWVNVQPADEDSRRIGLVFPAYDHNRTQWHAATSGKALLDAVLRFAATTGEPFYMSLNETSAAILRKTTRDGLQPIWSSRADVPEPVGKVRHLGDWSRVLTDDEEGQTLVDRYDINAAEASVNTGVFVGVGEPELVDLTTFRRGALKETAGYVLANVPRQHPGLDPRLPDLLTPWQRVDERTETSGGPAWAPIELLCLLDEQGVPIEPSKALIWRTSRRLLRAYGERVSKARLELVADEQNDEPATLTLAAVKALYKSRIGDFNRETSRIYRPDVRDMIIAKARANAYRSLRKIARTSGRYPVAFHVDAAYYVSDDTSTDREADEVRPAGMTIAPRMGAWKHEITLPLARVREFLGERSFSAKVEKLLKGER